MKSVLFILMLIPAFLLQSCMHATPTSFTALGTDFETVEANWGQGFKATKVNQSKTFSATTKLVDKGITTWGLTRTIDRWLDSEDATTAADAATRGKELDAANQAKQIDSTTTIELEKLKLMEPVPAAP